MASNKIKAFALTSAIAMAAVIGSTSLAEARYCRGHWGYHRHCYSNTCRGTYWGYYRPAYVSTCWRPRCGYYGANWPGYYGYGGGLLGAGTGLLGAGLFGWW